MADELGSKDIDIVEEFYQISPEILSSLNLTKPPLDLHYFNEKIGKLRPYVKAKQRLSKEQQEEILELSKSGKIFVSRKDKPIYIKHIGKQLDLILQDKHLKESEAADAIDYAMKFRVKNLYEQPIKHHLEKLLEDVKVMVEYLLNDPLRIRSCVRRLSKSNDLITHSVNSMYIGTGIYLDIQSKEILKRYLEGIVLGHLLLNLGLCKIPPYIREKNKENFTREELDKYIQYPLIGAKILQKHGIRDKIAIECILEHQERIDGSGFPRKLKGDEMSLPGKIAAVSYAFCEMIPSIDEINGANLRNIVQKLSDQKNKFDQKVCSSLLNVIYNSFK